MTTQPEPVLPEWKNSHDFKQAVYAADKLLDEPWADPDDDARTVARQFNRMVERYDALATELAAAVQKERERIMQEVVKWKLVIGANFFHQMAAKQLYELIEALTDSRAKDSNK